MSSETAPASAGLECSLAAATEPALPRPHYEVFTEIWELDLERLLANGSTEEGAPRPCQEELHAELEKSWGSIVEKKRYDVASLFERFWYVLCKHPACERLFPARLLSCTGVDILIDKMSAAKASGMKVDTCFMHSAVESIVQKRAASLCTEKRTILLELLEAFAASILQGRLGYTDPWNDEEDPPLTIAAGFGDEETVRFLLSKGASPLGATPFAPGLSPLLACYAESWPQLAFFEFLVKSGCDPGIHDQRRVELAISMFCCQFLYGSADSSQARKRVRGAIEEYVVKNWPEAIVGKSAVVGTEIETVLDAAVAYRDVSTLELLLSVPGTEGLFRFETVWETPSGDAASAAPKRPLRRSTALMALEPSNLKKFEVLVRNHRLLDHAYSDSEQAATAEALARVAVRSLKPADGSSNTIMHLPSGLDTIKLAVSAGFKWAWDARGANAMLHALFLGSFLGYNVCEEDVLMLLKLYHSAGIDVSRFYREGSRDDDGMLLSHKAAQIGWLQVLTFAITVAGCDGQAVYVPTTSGGYRYPRTVLIEAPANRQIQAVYTLLRLSVQPRTVSPSGASA
jgi:hypothetical protein